MTRAFVKFYSVKPNGESEQVDQIEVDTSRLWEVKHNRGVPVMTFFPVGSEEPVLKTLGQGLRWSLCYLPVR